MIMMQKEYNTIYYEQKDILQALNRPNAVLIKLTLFNEMEILSLLPSILVWFIFSQEIFCTKTL